MSWFVFIAGVWVGWVSLVALLVWWDRRSKKQNLQGGLDVLKGVYDGRLCAKCGAAMDTESGGCTSCGWVRGTQRKEQ